MKRKEQLKEVRGMEAAELREKESALREELMKLRFRGSSGQLEQTAQLSAVRKQIARVRTVLREMKQ